MNELKDDIEIMDQKRFNPDAVKPGCYDMHNEFYHSVPGISSSKIKKAVESVAHYNDASLIKKPTFIDMGTSVHTLILEPENRRLIHKKPSGARTSKSGCIEILDHYYRVLGKECNYLFTQDIKILKSWIIDVEKEARDRGFIFLSDDEEFKVSRMVGAIERHPEFDKLFKDASNMNELSFFSDHKDYGLIKCRPDVLNPAKHFILDLKTTIDPSPDGFARQIFNFGYHISAAFHIDTIEDLGIPVDDYYLGVVGNSAPFICEIYRLSNEAIKEGRKVYKDAFQRLSDAKESPELFDGYTDGSITEISIPLWGYKHG